MIGYPRRVRLIVIAAALATAILASKVSAEGLSTGLAPQPLADALEAFARTTGYELIYRSDLTAGLTSHGAVGNLSSVEVLRQILRGTDLDFEIIHTHTIVIFKADSSARGVNSSGTAAKHADGAQSHDARKADNSDDTKPGRGAALRGLLARIAGLFSPCGPPADKGSESRAFRQSDKGGVCGEQADSSPASDWTLQEIVVTGTRQSGLQVADSLAPIQIVSAEALQQAGGIQDLMGALAQIVPSLTVQAFGVDMAAQTLQARLRGLSPNDMLVLIDGKRRHTTANLAVASGSPYQGGAGVDLGFLPLDAIDHVEVLTEGAAAQYGTDAIAGVINIILKTKASGGALSGTDGGYYNGGGGTTDVSGNIGIEPHSGAYLNVTGEVHNHGHSDVGPVDERVVNPANLRIYPDSNMTQVPGYPRLNMIEGDAQTHLRLLSLNTGLQFDGGSELYAFATYGDKRSASYENYRLPAKVHYTDPGSGTTIYPFPFGFNPQEATRERDYAVTGGIKGTLAQWHCDLSTAYGDDYIGVYTLDSANAGLFALTGTPTPSNYYDGVLQATQWTTTLDLNRDFAVGLAGPLNIALGAEYRRDTYKIGPGIPASYLDGGAQSYPGFTPTDAGSHGRKNYAAYVDFAVKPTARLRIDAAGRYEHYSDFGSASIGKLAGRYELTPQLAIRGTVDNGFRAPTLAEEFYSSTNVTPHSAFVQLPPDSPGGRLLGLGNGLQTERSVAYSLGFVFRPLPMLNMTLDLYQITITNRIVASGSLLGSNRDVVISQPVLDAIAANGNSLDNVTETGLQLFTNGIDTRTRGADLAFNYPANYPWGRVMYSIGATYNQTIVTRVRPTPAQLGTTSLFDATALSDVTTASPKYVVDVGALWTLGNVSINLLEKVYGPSSEYESDDGDNPAGQLQYFRTAIPLTPVTDVNLSWSLGQWLKLSVGANNLFNRMPPHLNGTLLAHYDNFAYGDNQGAQAYPSFSPFGINGGFYYAKAIFTF